MVGAWWVVARSRSTRWRGVDKNRTCPRFYRAAGPRDSEINQMFHAYRYTAVYVAALLHCCCGLVGGWWVGGGGARGWAERLVHFVGVFLERLVHFVGVFSGLWEMALLYFFTRNQPNAPRVPVYSRVRTAALLYCCSGSCLWEMALLFRF